jgi:hypothetical protein
MVISTANNEGIGLTNPTTLLHIKGTNPILTIMAQGGSGAKSQINLSTHDEGANRASCSLIELVRFVSRLSSESSVSS